LEENKDCDSGNDEPAKSSQESLHLRAGPGFCPTAGIGNRTGCVLLDSRIGLELAEKKV
jgi:hypothetical protein